MILPSDPIVVPQPGFRSGPVSDSSIWVMKKPIISLDRARRVVLGATIGTLE
jgi:hypothetical protein